jgi:ABC-type multidrug transport system ATPase subunit/ABC-type multidrug transport system permease subunit
MMAQQTKQQAKQEKEEEADTVKVSMSVSLGFVPQHDFLLEYQTVGEALLFSAQLRRPDIPTSAHVKGFVISTLAQLGLTSKQHSLIGDLSGGERRRVSIGLELVADPDILLLDEPTTGLDSHTALNIITVLRTFSTKFQRAAVFSVHQIPATFLPLFDRILIMAPHGQTIFCGSPEMISRYLNRIDRPLPPFTNPAEFFLQLAVTQSPEMAREYRESKLCITVTTVLAKHTTTTTTTTTLTADETKKQKKQVLWQEGTLSQFGNVRPAFWLQSMLLFTRELQLLSRHPVTIATHNIGFAVLGLILGILFIQLDLTLQGMQNRLGVLFFCVLFFGFTSMSALPVFINSRRRFVQETASGYYHWSLHVLALTCTDLLFLRTVPPLLFSLLSYWLMGLQDKNQKFGTFVLVLVLANYDGDTFCLSLSACSSSHASANFVSVLCLISFMVFGGLFLNLESSNIIAGLSTLSFMRWAYEALVLSEFQGLEIYFAAEGAPAITLGGETIVNNIGLGDVSTEFAIHMLWLWFAIALLTTFGLFYLKHFITDKH